jgi:hypothetical protein
MLLQCRAAVWLISTHASKKNSYLAHARVTRGIARAATITSFNFWGRVNVERRRWLRKQKDDKAG